MKKHRLPAAVLALAALGFTLGTCEFVIVGILPDIAAGLNVSLAAVGRLVSVFAACYAVGTPLLTALTGRMDRFRLLIGLMLLFLGVNVLSMLAPGVTVLYASRVVAALVSGTLTAVAMLYAKGKDGDPLSPEAWAYVDNFIKNVDGKFLNSSGAVHKGAADGEYTVGLTWEDPAATYVKNGAPVKVVFPKEGAIFPGESVEIIKGAKHMENAKKFVDFMLSQKIQEEAGKTLTVRPLRKGVKLADYMTPQDQIHLFKNYDEGWVAQHKKEIVALWNQHLENSRQ